MDGRFYSLTIKVNEPWKPCLDISVEYEYPTTKEEVKAELDFYQWHFSQKLGRNISREEITVKPAEGELKSVITQFRVSSGEQSYICLLHKVHRNAPYVLPKIVEDLKRYGEELDLRDEETTLVKKAIGSLVEIIESEEIHTPLLN